MKILLLNQTFYPDNVATSQQLTDLAAFLEGKGHQVSVIADHRAYEDRRRKFPLHEVWKGVHIFRVRSSGFGKARLRFRIVDSFTFLCSLVLKLLRFEPQDVVISFTSPPLIGLFGMIFCWMKGGKSVQWLMDMNPDAAFEVGYLNRYSIPGRVLNWIFEKTLQGASSIVVLDRWMKERVVQHGADPSQVMVVPPWSVIKPRESGHEEQVKQFRLEHGLSDKFVVMYSGNHSVVHPLDTLLQTAKQLKDRNDIAFVFIGAGLRTKDVRKWKEEFGLENIIQLPLQPRDRVKTSFGSADLHCVVMGPGMSGLVHISKVYSVLASGKPFLFVGPRESHVGDLLFVCPSGTPVAHDDVSGVMRVIEEAQQMSQQDRDRICHMNLDYLKKHDPELTLEAFYESFILNHDMASVAALAADTSGVTD